MMQDWIVPLVTGLAGVAVGAIPRLIKTKRSEDRLDHRTIAAEHRQLLKDIRQEREEAKAELKELRAEHAECLEKAARQGERITSLEGEVERLIETAAKNQERLSKLENHRDPHDPTS